MGKHVRSLGIVLIGLTGGTVIAHCGKCIEDSCPDCFRAINNPGIEFKQAKAPQCTCKEHCSCKKMDCSLCKETKCPCMKDKPTTPQYDHHHISVAVGKTHTLSLPTNPSTGYTWVINQKRSSASHITVKLGKIEYADKVKPGSSGTQAIEITGLKPGVATFTLEYKRPWIKEATSTGEHYTVEVTATK